MLSEKVKSEFLLLICTLIWGSTFVIMKTVLNFVDFTTFITVRFGLATIFMLIFCGKKLLYLNRNDIKYGSIFGILLFAGITSQVWALKYTTASNVALMYAFYIVLVPILAALFLKKPPKSSSVLGIIIATIGMFFLANTSINSGIFDFGIVLALISSICYALQVIFVDKFSNKSDESTTSFIQLLTVTILSLVCSIFNSQSFFVFNNYVIFTLLYTALFATTLGYTIQIIFQKNTNPTHAVIIFSLESLFGVGFAAVIPGIDGATESIGQNTIMGCLFLAIGFLISQFNLLDKLIGKYKSITQRS